MTLFGHQEAHEPFSTLESFRDDETARAPQPLGNAITVELIDVSTDALELDVAHSAPEVRHGAQYGINTYSLVGVFRYRCRGLLQYPASRSRQPGNQQ